MLRELVKKGAEVRVLGATVTDAPAGLGAIMPLVNEARDKGAKILKVRDNELEHLLVLTKSSVRSDLTASEQEIWFHMFREQLQQFRPNFFWFYGGQSLDLLAMSEAKFYGATTVAYLVNGNYRTSRWARDVDYILTDTAATADFYHRSQGYNVRPIGTFIDPQSVVAPSRQPSNILFINPTLEKGAAIVAQLALLLEDVRPDIKFEVIESRGKWAGVVEAVTSIHGEGRTSLRNVTVTPNTNDMRPIYARARVLICPSLWWESGARVLAEAMLNGIPAIVTNRGGSPEMVGPAGIKLDLPDSMYEPPYMEVPKIADLQPLASLISKIYDDQEFYENLCANARHIASTRHDINKNSSDLYNFYLSLL